MKNLMQNILKGFLLTSTMYVNILSANTTNATKASNDEVNQFYYNKGYKDGKSVGYAKGYKDAIKDVLKVLNKYRNKMEAIESAKYLLKRGKITYPQVFKVWKNNNYQIVIVPPKIEDKLSITDLVNIPFLNNDVNDFSSNIENNDNSKDNIENKNAFHLQNENDYIKTPLKRTSSLMNKTKLVLSKTETIHEILINSGKSFIETPNHYEVFFNSINEKKNFCKNIGIGLCQ
jgi:hypothetical protein